MSGDTLTVNASGTSRNVTILDGAVETVNKGGISELTTINSKGVENVQSGGVANLTTVNTRGSLNLKVVLAQIRLSSWAPRNLSRMAASPTTP